jgi:dipeptidyl aminopeptidase/acylaminoacyl peptidase
MNQRCFRNLAFAVTVFSATVLLAQGPPPSIVSEGVPPVPAELKARMNQYQNMRSAFFSDWQPSGRAMLILTRFADTYQVHFVQAPGAARRQLTFFPDPVLHAKFSPAVGQNYFLFMMDTGGAEFFQFYRFDLSDGGIHLLTDGKSRNTGLLFDHRGALAAYMSTRRNGRDTDLYLVDPENPSSEKRALDLKGSWMPLDWSADDGRLLLLEEISVNETYLHVFDRSSGRAELLTPKGAEQVAYRSALWSKDGKGIYLVSDRGSGFFRLFYYDLGSRQFTSLTDHIPWDIEDIDLSHDGRVLAFTANVDGISELHLLDTGTRRELPRPSLPKGQVYSLKFHPQRPELAFIIDSAKSPADVYSYDLDSKKLERWTFSETGGLNAEIFQESQLIHYPTFDQVNGKPRMLAAFLTRPPAKFKPPYPVLIEIHGGPEGQARPGFRGRYNYYLNEMGIALLEPNVRGSTGYGKSFTKLDNGYLREDTVKDIGALLDWIAKQPDLDAKRVAVAGGSYGGYMSLATMTHYSDRLRCGIDVVGISNFVTFLESTQEYRRDLRRVEYGDERDPKMRQFLISISPLTNADKIRVPMLVVAGQNDPRVPVTESDQIVGKVRSNGGQVWHLVGKDEGHGFAKKVNSDYLGYASVLFLEQFLLGDGNDRRPR